jgi:hypothetical protein
MIVPVGPFSKDFRFGGSWTMEPTRGLEVNAPSQRTDKTEVAAANHGKSSGAESSPGPRSSKSRRKKANKPKTQDVQVELRNSDIEEIRAVLALKPQKREGLSAGAWIAIALAVVIVLAALSAWQWTASKEQAAENIAPPKIATPKPPEFALESPSNGANASTGSSAAQPTQNSTAPGSGN